MYTCVHKKIKLNNTTHYITIILQNFYIYVQIIHSKLFIYFFFLNCIVFVRLWYKTDNFRDDTEFLQTKINLK